MADISKISPDDGSTILNIKDSNAVHWADNRVLGAHNLYTITGTSLQRTSSYVTGVYDRKNTTITLNGTATDTTTILTSEYKELSQFDYLIGKRVRILGSAENTYFQFWIKGLGTYIAGDVFTFPDYRNYENANFSVHIKNGVTYNDVVVPLMLCLEDDPEINTFTPHTYSNRELTIRDTFYQLTSSDDLDDYTNDGKYFYESSIPTHAPEPSNITWAKVIVIGAGTPTQVVIAPAACYIRRKGGAQNTWENWFKYTGTQIQ